MKGRRASGTRTFLDVLKSWIGRGRTYDDDVRDLAAGTPLFGLIVPTPDVRLVTEVTSTERFSAAR